jgi:hypothetical protein
LAVSIVSVCAAMGVAVASDAAVSDVAEIVPQYRD